MTTTEDLVRSTLTTHADADAPSVDGRAMLDRVRVARRRHRRTQRVVAVLSALTLVGVAGAGWWAWPRSARTVTVVPAATRAVTAYGLILQVPVGWYVSDWGPGRWSGPPQAMAPGPYISTVPTRSMCRELANGIECARANGIVTVPADGVIAWLSHGPADFLGLRLDDLGPLPLGFTCEAPNGTPFHAFRRIGHGGDAARVSLDGCIYGPRAATLTAQLQAVIDAMQPASPAPSPSAS